MKVFCATNIGCVRTVNEDSYYMPAPGQRFMAVADGMGGHLAGEVASQMAVRVLAETLRGEKALSEDKLRHAFLKANHDVYMEAERDRSKHGMGTTMTALWFGQGTVLMGHVGDSRAYRWREGKLMRLSTDHSYVEELVRSGIITREMALNHPQRNVITRSIGPWPRVEVDIERFDYSEKDVFLLCSDGLTRYVSEAEIERALKDDRTYKEKIDGLIADVLRRGGADNVTVMIVAGESDGNE